MIARYFPRIGISIDTLDPDEAKNIGRFKLHKVLKHIDLLIKVYDPRRIIVHTVDYGQDIAPVNQYLQSRGIIRHVIQPLQTKDDYARRYPQRVSRDESVYRYRCRYITHPIMRFYNIDGVEMPCAYIKDVSKYVSMNEIKDNLTARAVPGCCAGCREILAKPDGAGRPMSSVEKIPISIAY